MPPLDMDALQDRAKRDALRQRRQQRAAGEGEVQRLRVLCVVRQRNSKATPRKINPISIAIIGVYSAGISTA